MVQMDFAASLNVALRDLAIGEGMGVVQKSLDRQSTQSTCGSDAASETWSIFSDASELDEKSADVEPPAKPCCSSHKCVECRLTSPAACSGCGRLQQRNVSAFQCKTCSEVRCLSCHWMDTFDMAFDMAFDLELVGEASNEELVGERPSNEEGFETFRASIVSAPLLAECVEPSIASTAFDTFAALTAQSHSDETGMEHASFYRGKRCGRCQEPYRGFGEICADCRSCGPTGSVRECRACGHHFKGFGPTCSDCTSKSSGGNDKN